MLNSNRAATKNIHWINYVKAICVLTIYFLHAQGFFNYQVPGLAKYLNPFWVNAFFFVSGYLFFRKHLPMLQINDQKKLELERKRFLLNMLFRLIIPSILFSSLEFFPAAILQGYDISLLSFVNKVLLGGTFWFITTLIIAELIVFAMTLTGVKNIFFYVSISVVLFIAGRAMVKLDEKNIFEHVFSLIEKGFFATLMLAFGGLYWKYEELIDKHTKWYVTPPSFCFTLCWKKQHQIILW